VGGGIGTRATITVLIGRRAHCVTERLHLVGRCVTLRLRNDLRRSTMKTPPTVTPQEWEAARLELLVEEKQLTRARDALAAKRRRMPGLGLEKNDRFPGPDG